MPTPPAARSKSRRGAGSICKLGAAPEQHADITLEICDAAARRRSTRAACASCTRTSSCRWRACWRAWSAPACASTATELQRLSALMEARDRAAHRARSTRSPGKPFNISSPQQLGRVLFEDLNLPAPVKYGKGKTISTAADVLEDAGGGSRDRAQGARIPPAHQAEGHLRGRAAGADRPAHRPPAHQLQPDRRGHRAALLVQSQPAEHPHPHRTGPRDPRGVRAARGMEAGGGGLLADRAAPAGAHVGRSRCWWRRSATARTSTRARRRK